MSALENSPRLDLQTCPDRVELPGRTELLILVRDEFRVFLDEDFTWRTKIEFRGVIPEIFAMDARPDETAIGIDVHFGDAELGGWKVLFLVHPAGGGIELTAGRVDPLHFFHRHA